jgi:hypothetical protein
MAHPPHLDTAPYLPHIRTHSLHLGRFPPQPVSLLGPSPTLSTSFRLAQAIFEPAPFPCKDPNILNPRYSPGKDPVLPSSYLPTSLLDTPGKLFEKILLSRVLCEVSECGLLRDEQFGFRPKHSTALQLARLVEGVSRNFDVKRLRGAVFTRCG